MISKGFGATDFQPIWNRTKADCADEEDAGFLEALYVNHRAYTGI